MTNKIKVIFKIGRKYPLFKNFPIIKQGMMMSEATKKRRRDWKNKEEVNYLEEVTKAPEAIDVNSGGEGDSEKDEFYDQAVAFVLETRRASISAVQRKFRIGYNRAARLIETMEEAGLVSEMSSNGSREVLDPKRD